MDRDRGHADMGYFPREDPNREYRADVSIMVGPNPDLNILSNYYASIHLTEHSWISSGHAGTKDICHLFISLNGPGKGKAEKKARNALFSHIGEAAKKAKIQVEAD